MPKPSRSLAAKTTKKSGEFSSRFSTVRDKIPYVTRRGGFLYNFWRDKDHPRGLWRCTTMSEFVADDPPWEILIDVDALAEEDGEDWVWQGATTLLPSHDRAMIRLSRGGSDACVLRESTC